MKQDRDRFDRNERLFGASGQRKLRQSRVAVVGIGGLGTHVVQQLALLGVGGLSLIDDEEISITNKNRYIGVHHLDLVPGTPKVDTAARLIQSIDPQIAVRKVHASLVSVSAFSALKEVDHVFGCLDDDGARFVLNDFTTAYGKPYIDLASDVAEGSFGGRVVVNWGGDGCLFCFDELDQNSVQAFLESEGDRANREAVYGVDRSLLNNTGPSVVSINGTIASLAVSEYMMAVTGLSEPVSFLNYDGRLRRVSVRKSHRRAACPYCAQWGSGSKADVERYIRLRVASG